MCMDHKNVWKMTIWQIFTPDQQVFTWQKQRYLLIGKYTWQKNSECSVEDPLFPEILQYSQWPCLSSEFYPLWDLSDFNPSGVLQWATISPDQQVYLYCSKEELGTKWLSRLPDRREVTDCPVCYLSEGNLLIQCTCWVTIPGRLDDWLGKTKGKVRVRVCAGLPYLAEEKVLVHAWWPYPYLAEEKVLNDQ